MLKNLKEFSKLKKELKNEVVDIFLFGSAVKGKSKPKDIDVCLIFKENVNLKSVRKAQEILGDKYHVSSLQVNNFFTKPHSLAKTLLLEGISIFCKRSLSEVFGLKSQLFYSYDLSGLKPSKKVSFVHLMRGRGKAEGLIAKGKGEFISKSAFLVTIEKDNEIREVLDCWEVKYKRKKVMLMD